MEQLGSHYAVLLQHPQLREGLIEEAHQSQAARASIQIRRRLAQTLRALACRVDPYAVAIDTAVGTRPRAIAQ
jgi:hypothetical protein